MEVINPKATPPLLRGKCLSSYADFAELMQDDGWFDPVHRVLCDWVQGQIERGWEEDPDGYIKLIIVMPRGSLKSTIITKYLSVWLTLNDPTMRTLIATNTLPNARKKLADIRNLFDGEPLFRALFPELLPEFKMPGSKKRNSWSTDSLTINRDKEFPEGTFEAAGMRTKKTGTHYTCIVEDDTVAPDESEMKVDVTLPSTETIERAIGWHKASIPLMPPKGRRLRIIVTTRWGDYDLVSYLQDNENYFTFNMPALHPKTNEAVFSKFYTKERLDELSRDLGPYMFSCLYLNQPMDANLRTFKKDWIQYRDRYDIPMEDKDGYFSIAVDPAISETDEACETAITEVYHFIREGKHPYQYWTEAIHAHINPYETVTRTLNLAEDNWPRLKCILVEGNAYQNALKWIFWEEMAKRDLDPKKLVMFKSARGTGKDARIQGMVAPFSTGRIFLRSGISSHVESQLIQYPNGRLVDIIDSFSMHRKVARLEVRPDPAIPEKNISAPTWMDALTEVKKKHSRIGSMSMGTESNFDPFNAIDSGFPIYTRN